MKSIWHNNWSANSPMTWYEKGVFGLLYALFYSLSLLPFQVLYLLSDGVYLLIYRLIGYRKKIVEKNLRLSFPEKSEEERKEIEREFYHFFCDYIFETIKLCSISKDTMRKHVVFKNIEYLQKAVEEQRGVGAYLGHYCNWEWTTSIELHAPKPLKGCQVYHVLESKVMDKLLLRIRSRMGTDSIPMAEILRHIVRSRKSGVLPLTGFISDQSPIIYNIPHWMTFLNQSTPFITGTERLIKKLDMLPVYLDFRRVKRGYYEVTVVPMCANVKELPDWQLTEEYAHLLEASIRRQPAYWLWTHNRWKRKPEEYTNACK